jgi:hypothetical protein
MSDDAEAFLKTFPRDALIWEFSQGIAVAQIGMNFETALRNDPKMALAGMAVGMIEASPLGTFLDIAFVYVGSQFERYNQYGANLPTIEPGWWHNLIGADNPDPNFQAGRAAGQVGMGVSDIVVGLYSVPSSTALGGSLGAGRAGNVVVASTSGVMTLEQAKALGLLGTRLLGIVGGMGNLGAAMSRGDDDGNGEESEEPDFKDVTGRDFEERLLDEADDKYFGPVKHDYRGEWELIEGPIRDKALVNEDPMIGSGYRYYATFRHMASDETITLSINYDPETGLFGIIKESLGLP